jgi:hypothetical protein
MKKKVLVSRQPKRKITQYVVHYEVDGKRAFFKFDGKKNIRVINARIREHHEEAEPYSDPTITILGVAPYICSNCKQDLNFNDPREWESGLCRGCWEYSLFPRWKEDPRFRDLIA